MDNGNVDPSDGQQKDTTPILDKVLQNNPFIKMGEGSIENIKTQSMVQSTREEADERLAAIDAYNQDVLRRQKLAEDAAKAKRTGIYIALGIFFAGIFVALIWLAINAVIAMTKPIETSGDSGQQGGGEVVKEKCTPETCSTLAKVSSTLTLLRGEKKIYLYDSTTKKAVLTTVPERTYHAITPFVWGKDTFVVLDPESSQSALYNVSKNRLLTEFSYDTFYYDVKNKLYDDLSWVVNDYIIGSTSGDYRLIDLSSGEEVIRATERVYVRDGYFVGKEKDGMLHVYLSKDQKLGAFEAGTSLYLKNNYLVVIAPRGGMQVYNQTGKLDGQSDVNREVSAIHPDKRISTLDADSSFHKINL